MGNCDCCGRFHDYGPGSAWKMVFSGWPLTPDNEKTRCRLCVAKFGEFMPQDGVRPQDSCGVVKGVVANQGE